MSSESVRQAVRFFLLLVFRKQAILLCSVKGKASKLEPERPALSEAGIQAIHSE
jgi:hypothetical protein